MLKMQGGGLCAEQDFVLKTHGGLMRKGGIFAGHYGSNIPQTEKHDPPKSECYSV